MYLEADWSRPSAFRDKFFALGAFREGGRAGRLRRKPIAVIVERVRGFRLEGGAEATARSRDTGGVADELPM